jgi:hypothetical protein
MSAWRLDDLNPILEVGIQLRLHRPGVLCSPALTRCGTEFIRQARYLLKNWMPCFSASSMALLSLSELQSLDKDVSHANCTERYPEHRSWSTAQTMHVGVQLKASASLNRMESRVD